MERVRRRARESWPGARAAAGLCVALAAAGTARAERCGLTEERVLLVWNSQNADSQAVRDLYVAAHPNVLEFDLNDSVLAPLGTVLYSRYNGRIRTPIKEYLDGMHPSGTPLREWVVCIATTRGLPARIDGSEENNALVISTFASVESELTLLQHDVDQPASGIAGTLRAGLIDNPYHRMVDMPITQFDRSHIADPREFTNSAQAAFTLTGLTPGDMYLVVRIDAAPSPTGGATAVDNIAAMLDRSHNPVVNAESVQGVFDEFACGNQLDDDGFAGIFPGGLDDFEDAANALSALGVPTFSDDSSDFFVGTTIPDQTRPLLFMCSYGKNHSPQGCGDAAPNGYVQTFTNVHPAAFFHSIESFNGDSMIDGDPRQNQGQVLDFLAAGGSFTIGNLAEPFSFSVADSDMIAKNLYTHGLTFAEAAWSSIPGLSWQQTPVGDPLARVRVVREPEGDMNGDHVVNTADLGYLIAVFTTDDRTADLNNDCVVNTADLGILLMHFGATAPR